MDKLQAAGVDSAEVDNVRSTFSTSSPYGNMFEGLKSYHLHTKYCREHFNFVVST